MSRLDFQPDESQLSPIVEGSSPVSIPAPEPIGGNAFQRCSIPALTPVSADSLRQFVKSGIPQNRTTPLPILASPARTSIAAATPSSAGSTGTTGSIAYGSKYVYICTAPNTWLRAALTTF